MRFRVPVFVWLHGFNRTCNSRWPGIMKSFGNMFKNIFFATVMPCGLRGIKAVWGQTVTFICGLWAMVALLSCSGGGNGDEMLPSVTVSIPPLEYFAKAIGGDSLRVISLLPESADPETFSPGVSVMRELATSKMFVTVGVLPFEDAMLENIKSNNPDMKVAVVCGGIDFIYGTHSHEGAAGDDDVHEGKGEPDPHVWSSVRNARIIAGNMFDAIVAAAPQHREYFKRRYDNLVARIDSIDQSVEGRSKGCHGLVFAVWHPSLSYFARDYGIEQIAFNVENKETSPVRLRSQLDYARSRRVGAFIVPAGIDKDKVAVVATGLGLEPVSVNLMSADWERQMFSVIDALIGEPATKTQHK